MEGFLFFCARHPALLHGVFFLLGLAFIQERSVSFLLPLLVLLVPLGWKARRSALPLFVCFLLACLYGHVTRPILPSSLQVEGVALFVPSELKVESSHFKKRQSLKGTITRFKTSSNEKIQNLPCSIELSREMDRPFIRSSYYIQGSLQRKENSSFFTLKPDPATSWKKASFSFSLVEIRSLSKSYISKQIHNIFSDVKVADLMTALTVGSLDDRMLKFDFGKLGLQHVLAISGFHFGLLAFFLSLLFRALFPERISYIFLLIFLTLYFLLLGNSPSIVRAYLALCLYLVGKIGKWRTNGLNILGATLFLELLINPQVITHLGFQLSFLATFSILFLLPVTKNWMLLFFPRREEWQLLQMRLVDRWGYLFCCFLRSSMALNIAVSLATIPVCLFTFHKFPLISLAYNLFVPLSLSLSLFLFFGSLPLFLLMPLLASLLTSCNEVFTRQILGFISQSPLAWDIYLRVDGFPLIVLMGILLGVFSLPFFLFHKQMTNTKKAIHSVFKILARLVTVFER